MRDAGGELLIVENLRKWFPIRRSLADILARRERRYVRAVDGVSFTLMCGEVFCLVGESGCGKTTTGKLIVRALRPTSGKMLYRVSEEVLNELKALRVHLQGGAFVNLAGHFKGKADKLLSRPYVAVVRGASTEEVAPVEVSVGHVEIPVLKACEESDECVVVRAFNPYGREGSVTLRFRGVEVVGAERTNMLEECLSEARLSGDGSLALRIEPFKVATYKLMLKHRRRSSNLTHA